MFGAIKKIFKKKEKSATPFQAPPTAPAASGRAPAPAAASTSGGAGAAGETLELPFRAILSAVPTELHGQLAPAGAGEHRFALARKRALEQIAQGAVKVAFGELRRAAPTGLLVNSSSHDARMISLPLGEILTQLRSAAFARRPDQRRVEIAADVPDLFGATGKTSTPVRVMGKGESQTSPSVMPTPSGSGTTMTPRPGGKRPTGSTTTLRRAPEPNDAPPSSPAPKASAPAAPALAAPASSVLVPLKDLSPTWPEPVRQEIEQLGLAASQCALPVREVEEGLRRGRMTRTWEQIFGSLLPKPAKPCGRANSATVLDLALGAIVPPYMAVAKPGPAQKKVTVSDSVPNVFVKSQGPGATQSPAPVPAAAPTPAAPAKPSSAPAPKTAAPKTIPAPANLSVPPAASKRPEAPSAPVPAPAAALAPTPASNAANTLALDLQKISENWPEAIRKEIDHMELAALRFEVPLDVMENGLRFGKVDFLWKQICTWINCPPAAPSQPNAETRVELPLNIVAPLYLKVRPPRPAPKPASIAVDVPDVFSPTGRLVSPDTDRTPAPPKAATAPAPVAPAPAPVPAPVASPAAAAPAASAAPSAGAKKQPLDIAELFGEPEKRNWTPNEIVHKTACLPGVAGAMIALQDGLLVAQCLPPNWKTETIAAFLPQIFGRMTQYSKELKMGDLRSISFTVEHGTLQVFNAGIIYFAALGKPGADLPSHELNIIAAELSRHTK